VHASSHRAGNALSAYEIEAGLWRLSAGLTDWLTLSTYPPGWVLGAAAQSVPINAFVRLRPLNLKRISSTISAGVYRLNASNLVDDSASLTATVIPLTANVAVSLTKSLSVEVEGTYVKAILDGEFPQSKWDVLGASTVDNVQAGCELQLALTSHVALFLKGQYLMYTGPLIVGSSASNSAGSEANLEAEVQIESLQHAFSLATGADLSAAPFFARLGIGYGNFTVPELRLVLPYRTIFPEVDLGVRF